MGSIIIIHKLVTTINQYLISFLISAAPFNRENNVKTYDQY